VITGWVVLPLVLAAAAAAFLAVLVVRERRAAAALAEHITDLNARIADLEATNAAIRSALDAATDALGPDPTAELARDSTSALTDAATGLFNEQFFRVTLETRVSAARRHLRPVAVVLVQVASGVREGSPTPTDPAVVAQGVRATLRDADTACRLDDGSFALILEDTPENGAVWTVERVRRALAVHHAGQTLWAGIACYPAHAFDAWELFERASNALGAAREWHQDRIEVATSE